MDYESVNRANWDERAPLHAASPDYNIQEFINKPEYISDVVRFDQALLGDITGLSCVHLQCHIATDTLSLARLGASSITGLDFSGASLKEARNLANATRGTGGEKLRLVEASVYDGLKVLEPSSFDLVFTGIGAICWLPSIKEWAKVVSGLLKPGGRLFIREGHPVIWSLDEKQPNLTIDFPYFEHSEPMVFQEDDTYVDTGGKKLQSTKTVEFNHGLGEIIQALLSEGLRITGLTEHQSIPWNAIPGQMEEIGGGEYRLKDRPWRLPHSYTLQATKQ